MHVQVNRVQNPYLTGLICLLMAAAAITALVSPIAAFGLVALIGFVTFVHKPKWSLYAVVLLFPLIHFKPVAGLKPAEMFILIIFASAFLLVISGRQHLSLTKPVAFLLLFIGICIASFVHSMGIRKDDVIFVSWIYSPNIISANWIMRFVVIALILLIVPWVITDKRDLRKIMNLHIFAGTMASLFGFLLVGLFLLKIPVTIPICRSFGGFAGMWGLRLAGTAYEPAGFANYLLAVIPVTMAVWLDEQDRKRELMLLGAFIVQCFAMLFTLSSGGWIAAIIATSFLLYRLRTKLTRRKKRGLFTLILIPVIAMGFFTSSGVLPIDRATFVLIGKFTTDTAGKTDRIGTNSILIRIIKDHPLLGIGPGNFVYLMGTYSQDENTLSESGYQVTYPATWRANNDYLTVAAETGIPGFIVFMLFLASLLVFLSKAARRMKDSQDEAAVTGVLCAVLALLMQAFVSFTIFNPFMWVMSAVVYGYYRTVVHGPRPVTAQ